MNILIHINIFPLYINNRIRKDTSSRKIYYNMKVYKNQELDSTQVSNRELECVLNKISVKSINSPTVELQDSESRIYSKIYTV